MKPEELAPWLVADPDPEIQRANVERYNSKPRSIHELTDSEAALIMNHAPPLEPEDA